MVCGTVDLHCSAGAILWQWYSAQQRCGSDAHTRDSKQYPDTQLSARSVARTHIQRTLGNSSVQCYMPGQGTDNKQYTLCRSIRWAIKQPHGWVSITLKQQVHKTMQRSFEYTDLLEIARRKVYSNWLKANLSVEHRWIM